MEEVGRAHANKLTGKAIAHMCAWQSQYGHLSSFPAAFGYHEALSAPQA